VGDEVVVMAGIEMVDVIVCVYGRILVIFLIFNLELKAFGLRAVSAEGEFICI
jgi:hypothetical protein